MVQTTLVHDDVTEFVCAVVLATVLWACHTTSIAGLRTRREVTVGCEGRGKVTLLLRDSHAIVTHCYLVLSSMYVLLWVMH